MDIYEKIDAIFSGEAEEKPQWANELLSELKEIKSLLIAQKEHVMSEPTRTIEPKDDKAYFDFVKRFRIAMRADTQKNIYPIFDYKGKKFGIDFNGLLYDRTTSKTISRHEAFKIYRFAYEEEKYSQYSA